MRNITPKNNWLYSVILLVSIILWPDLSIAIDTSIDAFNAAGAMNNIVSDDDFIAINSMTESQIQDYLISNDSYLKDYQENGKSAARIIYEASLGLYDAAVGTAKGISITSETGTISPRIILVYLQKEQSLITKTTRDEYALTYAMGYDCPDSTGCSGSRHPGFAEQVGWGAWQLRYNFEIAKKDVEWWNEYYPNNPEHTDPSDSDNRHFYIGFTRTFYSWNGSNSVTLSNAATASVYRYTPHVFDSAYNVWQFFNGWEWPAPPSGGEAPAPAPPPKIIKPGDINDDDTVDILDLSIFSNTWGQTGEENKSDFNNDGVVDIQDLSTLASNWGK